MDGFGIAQLVPGAAGIHLSWSGPKTWVYAPSGFTVQRRDAGRLQAKDCEQLDAAAIAQLRIVRERPLRFGVITVRSGGWLDALDQPSPATTTITDVFRVDLDHDHQFARLVITAKLSFVTALCEGRVVAVSGPASGPGTHFLAAPRIDAIVAVTLDPGALQVCVDVPGDEAADWEDVPAIVKGLTLPLLELMPGLTGPSAELAEARSRLLPGEDIDPEEFRRLTSVVRPMVRAAGPPRPSELAMLLREEPDADADEVRALDPIRVMLAHPTWRRALGFAFFDNDPTLVPGTAYEYRITASLPAEDLRDANHGFATVPSGTLLPTDFTLAGVRLRLPQPTPVMLDPSTPADGLVRLTRRGIRLDPRRESFWLTPSLDDWSLVIDFPTPTRAVILELADDHDLEFAIGPTDGPFDLTVPVPAGGRPRLVFAQPVTQLRLRGKGFLYAVRESTAKDDPLEVSVILPPIVLADTPPPRSPLTASAGSLQTAQPPPVGLVPSAEVANRHALGFTVSWRPAPAFNLNGWPPDLDAAVPLDATIFQIERRAEPSGPWRPVIDEDNWTLGDRDATIRDVRVPPGSELMLAFPESASAPTGNALDLTSVDALDPDDATAPKPGDLVSYRVRAIDAIGRTSAPATQTTPTRLEKHRPPPVPVEVQARVLVRDADDLTPAEGDRLGSSHTMIILSWAWPAEQRVQDRFATEFRVYAAPPKDVVTGMVLGANSLGPGRVTSYTVELQLDRPIASDIAAGLRLDAGHPFLIRSHTGGSTITMTVETRLRVGGVPPVPALGPVRLNVPMTADRSRPPAWGARVETVPITAATAYEVAFTDRLVVSADRPTDSLWVGVSSADDQSYVPDQLDPADSRPGNESAIVPMQATARYAGRPVLEIPPPLAPVPLLRTPEPTGEPIHFPLELTAFLPPAALTRRVRHERVAAGALIGACTVTADGRVLALPVEPRGPGDAEVEITVPNPDDRAELVAALRSGRSTEVDDRFLVYLAGQHRYRDRLFVSAHEQPLPPGPFAETLPPGADRWIYRVRGVDAAGHVSTGSATAKVVVRVPSLQSGAPPLKLPREPGDAPELLRVRIGDDPSLTHLLLFSAPSAGVGPVVVSDVIRVPNRPDLLPEGGLYLRAPDGALLTPTAIGIDPGEDATVTVPGAPGDRTRVWLATLTGDGVPSPLAGPYTILLPVPV